MMSRDRRKEATQPLHPRIDHYLFFLLKMITDHHELAEVTDLLQPVDDPEPSSPIYLCSATPSVAERNGSSNTTAEYVPLLVSIIPDHISTASPKNQANSCPSHGTPSDDPCTHAENEAAEPLVTMEESVVST